MRRLAWKRLQPLWFILLVVFSGCGESEPSIEQRVAQAETLLDAGQIDSAIRLLENASERAPERVDVLESLAFAYAAADDPVLASLTFQRIAELVPQRPEYLLYAAEYLLEAGDGKGAVTAYRAYLDVRPDDRAVWVALGDMMISQGRLNEALEALLAAEQLEGRASQRLKIGELYLRRDNLAQAQAWFARALESPGEHRDQALLGLLETAVRSRRYADAEALLGRLDAEFPGRLEQSELDPVRDQLAEWRRRQQAAREATAALDQRGRLAAEAASVAAPGPDAEPSQPESGSGQEQAAERTGHQAPPPDADLPAEQPAEQPAEAAPPTPVPVADQPPAGDALELARQARQAGDLAEAIRQFKRALIQDDTQPAVWAELSAAYLEAGNDRWAQATASEAMRREPDNPQFVLQFLRAAQRTMDADRLISEMESAYRRFPGQPSIVLILARTYANAGNTRNARILFTRFLEMVTPDHPVHAEVEQELLLLGR
jgi:tetratricopeptide (TPR) repeat protein